MPIVVNQGEPLRQAHANTEDYAAQNINHDKGSIAVAT
jgi:hypothetical protein